MAQIVISLIYEPPTRVLVRLVVTLVKGFFELFIEKVKLWLIC